MSTLTHPTPKNDPQDFDSTLRAVLPVVGRSHPMQRVVSLLRSLAGTSTTVLVTGESGAGKELVARLLHETGGTAGPYLAHNCAALGEGTLESDLFGHVAGSFTGATGLRRGLFEEAEGGTLFLDEIGEVGGRVQAQLLRVLEQGEIRRVGESRPRKVRVRTIAATNRDLARESRNGRFREDLFYRLNVVEVHVPPLRDRRIDIPDLVRHFVAESVRGDEPWEDVITPLALERLITYSWPGNVRQLRNEILRAAILTRGRGRIEPETFSLELRDAPTWGASLADRVEEARRQIVVDALDEHEWNKTRTARALGVSRQGLVKMLHRLRIPLARPERSAAERGAANSPASVVAEAE